ncbi:MAG: NADH-quinone oxidoreductase subunit NuoN, partial [Promicromonosporaceae bacterium]|nr:NADH-quinone oxidoreductase subunit NuoN [Promicromonosporaceae bacterium]
MNQFVSPSIAWAGLSPLLCVFGGGVLGVLVEAFVPAAARRRMQVAIAALATGGALIAVACLWGQVGRRNLQGIGGTFDLSPFGLAAQGVIATLALLALVVYADCSGGDDAFTPMAAAPPGSRYEEEARRAGLVTTEVFPLSLFAVGGMLLLTATDDLMVLFIALEVLSLPLYVLCATARRRRLLSQEAALKYFLLGAFASALTAFGIALLYGVAGSVRLPDLADVLRGVTDSPLHGLSALTVLGLILLCSGLLFKVGAVPFHAWTPDVYTGAPTPVTGFMAACTKAAAFAALTRVLFYLGASLEASTRREVQVLLWTVAIATMVVGTVVAVVQQDVKRMLAYSAISHAGFILVALVGFADDGAAAILFYLTAYGLATVGAFACVTLVRRRVGSDLRGEATGLAQWAGLGRQAPWLTAAFALFMLSMAGIPLTAGFIAKFGAFSAAVDAGAWPLALVGALASAVSGFFSLRLLATMVMSPAPAVTSTAAP